MMYAEWLPFLCRFAGGDSLHYFHAMPGHTLIDFRCQRYMIAAFRLTIIAADVSPPQS